jgi:hypothetical protein
MRGQGGQVRPLLRLLLLLVLAGLLVANLPQSWVGDVLAIGLLLALAGGVGYGAWLIAHRRA